MRYFVISDDGNKYGPADMGTLAQWAGEGRLLSHQFLEEEGTGRRVAARDVSGLTFGAGAAPGGGYAPGGGVAYPRPVGVDASGDIRNAWIFGVLSLVQCCPIIFGILGLLACKRAQEKGVDATGPKVLSILGLVIMVILGITRVAMMSRGN